MSACLVYLMGPSGVGKDSLLGWLQTRLPTQSAVHWARRTITRAPAMQGELHESLSDADFDALKAADAFGLDWQANGLRYGIRREELAPLQLGTWVFVNGSRAHWPQASLKFPTSRSVLITASAGVLRQRLLSRDRESAEEIEARLARLQDYCDSNVHCIVHNDGTLDEAGAHLLKQLQLMEGWPHALHHD